MARGRGGKFRKFSNNKKEKVKEDLLSKRQYEEFGEAHPIEEKESRVKRLKVEDYEETRTTHSDEDSEGALSEEEEDGDDGDPLSKLLATFNTQTGKAVDSDEEEEEEEEDSDDEGEEDSDDEEEEDSDDEEDSSDEEDDKNEQESDDEEDVHLHGSDAEDSDKEIEAPQEGIINPQLEKSSIENLDTESLQDEEETNDLSDEEEDSSSHDQGDPFSRHFERNISELVAGQVRDKEKWVSAFHKWPTFGRVKMEVPKIEVQTSNSLLLAEEEIETDLPSIGLVLQPPDIQQYNLQDYYIRETLQNNLALTNNTCSSEGERQGDLPTNLTNLQKELLCVVSNYSDLYYPEAGHEHWDDVRVVYTLHSVNHILKTRKRILNHNAKMKNWTQKKGAAAASNTYRDQGYSRPKVLILLPFKHSAYLVVNTIMTLLFGGDEKNVLNYSRFKEDFGSEEEESHKDKLSRPEDFIATFKGDIDEDFKIGLKVTKSTLRLYADFYQSDIILASPLGLRYIMGSSMRTDCQIDFLSSIEVLILDQADIFMMQNWEHILVIMEAINKPPQDLQSLNTDLNRVRLWSLEGHAPLYRQTVIFSATTIDHHRALIGKCLNFAGKMEVLNPAHGGAVEEVVVQTKLIINQIPGVRDPDARFHYFTTELLPRLRAEQQRHVLVYIPDYCDYVRLLRHLKEDGGSSISSINEYMIGENSKVAKARGLFFEGERHFMLYTERFHFYRRYRIKGVRHVVFYDLPTYPHFFSEICNLMVESNQNPRSRQHQQRSSTVTVIVQKSSLTRLTGVLGVQRTTDILSSGKAVHTCVLGR